MKNESPDLFRVSPLSEMQELLKMQMQQILPQHDEGGSVIYVFRVRKYLENIFIQLNFNSNGIRYSIEMKF